MSTDSAADFRAHLDQLGVPLLTSPPGSAHEFDHPNGWPLLTREGNAARLAAHHPGDAFLAVMGGPVAAVDVDPRNGGDILRMRRELDGIGVTVFAEVLSPSAGMHFYLAGHTLLATCHKLDGWPGVDIQSHGALLFLPGTERPKYHGGRYFILRDNLAALADGGDPDAAETFTSWVAARRGGGAAFLPAEPWSGAAPDRREAAYLASMLRRMGDDLGRMGKDSGRNVALYNAGLACGNFIAGTGLDEDEARNALYAAAEANSLVRDDGPRSVTASILSGITNGKARPRAVPAANDVTTLSSGERVDMVPGEVLPSGSAGSAGSSGSAGSAGSSGSSGSAGSSGKPLSEPEVAAVDVPPSWGAVDLTPYLDGSHKPAVPTLLTRSDGVSLLYPGLTHSMHGESESGKSLLAQSECVPVLLAGQSVLFVDFESDAGSITERLLMLGATPAAILGHLVYVKPEVHPGTSSTEADAWTGILGRRFALAVIDGVTDSLGVFGYSTKDNDDITAWMRLMPKRIAQSTGAAVVVIDHVTKDGDTRGRFAIGGQAKMSGLTGAAYTVEVIERLGRGVRGVIAVRVAKDRPGYVRGHAGPMRHTDRTQEVARVIVDSTGPLTLVTVEPHLGADRPGSAPGVWRPTGIMEKASEVLAVAGMPLSFRAIDERVTGKREHLRVALDALIAEGHVTVTPAARNAQMHTLSRPYRQEADPRSDKYLGAGHTQPQKSSVSVPVPYTGERGTHTQPVPGTRGEQSENSHTPTDLNAGRCPDCRAHIEFQGHRADCPERLETAPPVAPPEDRPPPICSADGCSVRLYHPDAAQLGLCYLHDGHAVTARVRATA